MGKGQDKELTEENAAGLYIQEKIFGLSYNRKTQIKITDKSVLTYQKDPHHKRTPNLTVHLCWWNCRETDYFIHHWWKYKIAQTSFDNFNENYTLQIYVPSESAIPVLGI